MKIEKTCLHRLFGDCPDCERNYDDNKHPNNYDCPRYYEVSFTTFEVYDDRQQVDKYST